jgi:ABC-2 type transport system ATP-binding protein
MVTITDLSFAYNRKNSIFSNINLTISAGNIYGLLGENGVGKTTLLRLICGLLFPNSGSCETFGSESKKRFPDMLEKIYYLPEVFDVPSIKISEYVKIYSELYSNFNHAKFEEYLEKFNIDTKKKMNNFSFGQQKKSLIAFALACNTQLILLDEPTNGLDIPSKSIFRQLITDAVNENTTFIVSTHQVRDLENLIDPIIILEHNQILLNNTVAEITDKLKFTLTPEPSQNALHSEQTLGGYLSVEANNDNQDSNLNIETLFNAAIKNKEFFKNTFMREK